MGAGCWSCGKSDREVEGGARAEDEEEAEVEDESRRASAPAPTSLSPRLASGARPGGGERCSLAVRAGSESSSSFGVWRRW